jgi:hypothetical protein
MTIVIDYKMAYNMMATLIDVSVNPDYSESLRKDAQLTAYWFKQLCENYSYNYSYSNYSRRLTQESSCYTRFGVDKVLKSFGFDFTV